MRIIGGKLKNRQILLAQESGARPTTGALREAVFNISQMKIEGAIALDLFAGSGAMGFEAISRGAAAATFVESDRLAAKTIKANIDALKLSGQAHLIIDDVLAALHTLIRQKKSFDWIYADPPYGAQGIDKGFFSHEILQIIDDSALLKPSGLFFIEECARAAPPADISLKTLELKSVRRFGRSSLQLYSTRE